ncbi:MAG: D-arabinose 5-phosphate isomerase, partial [Bacteroidetes bacterium]
FTPEDFAFLHPGGALGKRLMLKVDDVMEIHRQLDQTRQIT